MSESLIPERPIIVSPSLAASIGLEEAILLQHLDSITALGNGQQRDHYLWISTTLAQQAEQLPFWKPAAIRRILHNLVDLGILLVDNMPNDEQQIIELAVNQQLNPSATPIKTASPSSLGAQRIADQWRPDAAVIAQLQQQGVAAQFIQANVDEFVFYWRERNEASHAWSSKFIQHITRRWQTHQQHLHAAANSINATNNAANNIEKQWQPSLDAIEILERMGINRNFIDDAVAEFVLYWQERKEGQNTWNSKFVNHVKRQWARFTHTLKHDTEPKPISEFWKPDHEVFDVLAIANIELQFARDLIPEFVLFWRDKNELHHSWNTKFLQHVKYRWVRRNQDNPNAKGDAFERLSDRSWAADLI